MYGLIIYDSLMCVFLCRSSGRRQPSTCDCMRHKVLRMRPCSTQKHIGDWRVMFCSCLVLWGPCAGCGSSVSRLEVCKHQEGFGFRHAWDISLAENGRFGESVSHLSWACHGLSCNLGIDHLKHFETTHIPMCNWQTGQISCRAGSTGTRPTIPGLCYQQSNCKVNFDDQKSKQKSIEIHWIQVFWSLSHWQASSLNKQRAWTDHVAAFVTTCTADVWVESPVMPQPGGDMLDKPWWNRRFAQIHPYLRILSSRICMDFCEFA